MDSNIVEIYGPAYSEDPSILLLRKEAYYDLSQDAKEVLRLIINAPEEFFELDNERRQGERRYYVYNFLWKCKFRRRPDKDHRAVARRRRLILNDFKMVKEFISLFSGAQIWR